MKPEVPEPVAERLWRFAAMALALASVLLIAGDVLMWFGRLQVRRAELSLPDFRRYLVGHAACHVVAITACLWSLGRARGERAREAAMVVYAAVASSAISLAFWLYGTSTWNVGWLVVLVGAFRIFFNARLGLWALGLALVTQLVLALLLTFDLGPLRPALPGAAHDRLVVWVSMLGVLVAAWLAASFVAHRIRTTEHALRELNASLEERVQREVAERSKDLAEALAQLSHERPEVKPEFVVDGRYRVVRKLGSGGMGAVYEVERATDKQRLALKTLRGSSDPAVMVRFAREAQIAAEIQHPHLVPVLDVGLADGILYLVMPLLEGGSLEDQRARFGDPAWARPVLAQVAAGLAALHERAIVHRDLKPANVLMSGDVARIADFGIARLRDDLILACGAQEDALADTVAGSSGPALTQVGQVLGTPGYIAPELATGSLEARPPSDLFALGVLAYELVTGRRPFVEPPAISRRGGRPITPPDLDGVDPIIGRCLDLDPAQRPTAAEVAAAFSGRSARRSA